MSDLLISYTREIVCPHCGYEFQDSWEIGGDSEDLGLLECYSCEKAFYATRNVEITYSTQAPRYGRCKCCGKENTVIENYSGTLGSYDDFCVECGGAALDKFRRDYYEDVKKQHAERHFALRR